MVDAPVGVVMAGAKHFSQLTVWQLADALRLEVLELTRAHSYASGWKYRSQVEDAIDSVCRNIAEGFGADTHAQFAWFLRYLATLAQRGERHTPERPAQTVHDDDRALARL